MLSNLQQIGFYNVVTKSYKFLLWFNPRTKHWLLDNEEVGYGDIVFEEKILSTEFVSEFEEE